MAERLQAARQRLLEDAGPPQTSIWMLKKRSDGRLGRDAERGSVTTRGVDAGTGADLRRAATASAELG
jgi:hypothetical protein